MYDVPLTEAEFDSEIEALVARDPERPRTVIEILAEAERGPIGAAGDQENETKLAVHSIRHRLNHSLNPLNGSPGAGVRGRGPVAPA